ncbi:MAG: hypothetical protein GKR95_10180 [Gammaproteobacteria bacterium]|nr:hypothetical protein [Gammaproteobacteria bacterium]
MVIDGTIMLKMQLLTQFKALVGQSMPLEVLVSVMEAHHMHPSGETPIDSSRAAIYF